MRKFSLRYVLLLALFAVLFYAVSRFLPLSNTRYAISEPPPPPKYNVQVILKAKGGAPDFWRIVEQGIQMAGDELNIAYEIDAPPREIDIDIQIDLVHQAIQKSPDAIILAAGDVDRLVPVCQEVVDAGIRLIILDSDVNFDGRATLVATDNYALGQQMALLTQELIGSTGRFGVVGHIETSATAMQRRDGLLDNLPNAKNQLADIRYCDGDVDLARQQAIEILTQNPDIRCMVGLNESSALGVCYAVEELGLVGKIPVIACDNSEAEIKYMENGTIQAFVIQKPFNMGYQAMQATVQILDNKKVDPFINTGNVVITREDMRKPENQKLLFPFTN